MQAFSFLQEFTLKWVKTERLLLRPFALEDVEEMHWLIYSDPDVCGRYFSKLLTLEETRERMMHKIEEAPSGDFGSLAVTGKNDGVLMGVIQLYAGVPDYIVLEENPASPCDTVEVELSYALGRRYWGNGYITEAGRALITHAFAELGLKRLVNSAKADNIRSINVMKRLGFRLQRNLHPDWSDELVGILDNPMFKALQ